jgi:hypothetical protein
MRIHFAVYTIKESTAITGVSFSGNGLITEESHTHVSALEGVFGLTDGGHIAEIREIYLPK